VDASQLVLKTTAPRAHRMALLRERLTRLWEASQGRTLIAVTASAGFGKTTLLTQWRRLWLERGALVAWVTADANDDRARFAEALAHAMRVASGRAVFATVSAQYSTGTEGEFDALTGVLAEIANLATPTVVVIDDAERLPEATVREALAYLLHNAPPNLQVVIGSRATLPLPTADLAAHGQLAELRTSDLRLTLDESVAILGKRFGKRLPLDDGVRLHEATEGWPIGLQLAATAIERESDLHAAVLSVSGRKGDVERYFIETLLSRLPPPLVAFLIRISILDSLNAEVCAAVTGCATAAGYLDQLAANTPILMVAELAGWMRLHPMAREFLQARCEVLPESERRELHRRAADWLAANGRLNEAGRHALAAGDEALAHSCSARCLYTLMLGGQLGDASAWIDVLPREQLAADVKLRLYAAWIMALTDRQVEGAELAEEVLARRDADDPTLFMAALVACCAAGYTDRLGLIPGIFARAPAPGRIDDKVIAIAYANTLAVTALHQGATDRVRQIEADLPPPVQNDPLSLTASIGRLLYGLSHVWDGDFHKAEATLQAAAAAAERDAGRRSTAASMLAAVLAWTMYQRGRLDAARALLANRLDVIERSCPPDAVIAAYRTLGHLALDEGDERHALDVFGELRALGERKGVPRYALTSLVEQIRIHALRSRSETVTALLAELRALRTQFADEGFAAFAPHHKLATALVNAYAALGRHDGDEADKHLRAAETAASVMHRGADALLAKALRAVAASWRGAPEAQSLLTEAVELAQLRGIERLLIDAHPDAVSMHERQGAAGRRAAAPPVAPRAAPEAAPRRLAASGGGLLTPKEAEVLGLLDAGHSNKQIGLALDISDETVKWHVKNLFAKLNAGTRKHVVDRARMLGLLAG
jgi:LuxR family maltose regulon positive regulatory protein